MKQNTYIPKLQYFIVVLVMLHKCVASGSNTTSPEPTNNLSLEEMNSCFEVKIPDEKVYTTQLTVVLERIKESPRKPLTCSFHFALLVSEKGCQEEPHPVTEASNITGTNVKKWSEAIKAKCTAQYQATPEDNVFWNPASSDESGQLYYTIGESNCNSTGEHVVTDHYCNGPLKPDTEYTLIVRIIKDDKFIDTDPIALRTKHVSHVVDIVILTVYASLVTVAVVLLAVWLKPYCSKQWCRENNALQKKETSGISVKKFRGQYAQIYESNQQGKIKDEYESIVQYQDHNFNATARSAIANDSKNRYDDILPFDFNRVQLETEESDEGIPRDYINASFIDGYTNRREYIATQGPLEETCYDFWRMVFQYDVESIVMLIQPSGEDKNKCCQYYPLLNRNMEYEDIEVRCTQEINLSFYCRRKFTVFKGNVSKIVSQYHFLDWLTQGCPTSPSNLIDFIKIVRREGKNDAIPLVVHCSAGVGRTGTFIALDIILQRMEKEQQICVYSTVKELRRKRVHMVQTLDQYAFLYRCCLDFTGNKDMKDS